ncbi:very short patch repair endonuclease [Rhodococcus sp. UFZ-B548]|uniref:very short patch repair endonuclease n=1 Tax=Rhodococcus sp. UFZ-B548 TaxID=2742212 RepID=UPI0021750F6A|nr:very short patch repair endonuclease [Rhodococcus sp. UFZ-B548]
MTPAGRSRVMAAIRSKDTKPELALRKGLRAVGAVGYRVHLRDVPGRPDIAYTRWKVAIFVDGAFWHGHPDHWHPERATEYWKEKITNNQERDKRNTATLKEMGWKVVRFWDFEVQNDPASCVAAVYRTLEEMGRQPTGPRESG